MSLELFHPAVAAWFSKQFEEPTEPQRRAWPAIKAGRPTLLAAPTGSGKTLAAFLSVLDDLVRQGSGGGLPDETRVVYVSPLKALSADIQKNLREPLQGIEAELLSMGMPQVPIRVLVRTGDTPAAERAAMVKRPPHIIVTTPESLYILLTSGGGRSMLRSAGTVIVDEIHAVARDKRGTHLALSLERLDALAGRPLLRIGLSATQRPIERVARFLFGARMPDSEKDLAPGVAGEPRPVGEASPAGPERSFAGTAGEPRPVGEASPAGPERSFAGTGGESRLVGEASPAGPERSFAGTGGESRLAREAGSSSSERLIAETAGGGVERLPHPSAARDGTEGARPDAVADRPVAAGFEDAGRCTVIDIGHARRLDLAIEIPRSPLRAVMSNEVWEEIYDRLADLILEHRTTLVFVNTRRLAERVARHLGDRVGAGNVLSHHGSLARDRRLEAEQRLKSGNLRALVATASLELGIDIGAVDLVCQLGSTRSIATLLQRVGRSGHTLRGVPKGRLFPLSRDELIECAAMLDAVRRGELDRIEIPAGSLDVLAQQIVAAVSCEDWSSSGLFDLARRATPYRDLSREGFDEVVRMLARGFATSRGRRGALIHHDAVNGRLRGRRGARLVAVTSGGAIPDNADYAVLAEPAGVPVGTVNEDFAFESMAGDIFQLGNASWRILKIEPGKLRVEDARGQPPSIPFWLGEAPGRTAELSSAVSRMRQEIDRRLGPAVTEERIAARAGSRSAAPQEGAPARPAPEPRVRGSRTEDEAHAIAWLSRDPGVPVAAAEQIIDYLASARAALGAIPSQEVLVLERFFDETGGMQLVLHAPFGSRINRGWGLALRKRFCKKFNFELQAAATEDSIVLSLGQTQSFPLEEVFSYLRSRTVREVLTEALLDAPMFGIRWRWNATRALAIPRWRGGRKVPPPLVRMQAEDLLAAVFPDQLACLQDKGGAREVPDHPLVNQTLEDCLEEAMDIRGLEAILAAVEQGRIRCLARDLTEPSPLAQEVLSARPYAFLDDAPIEERRTQAVLSRRWLDAETAAGIGRLDPAAIERVRGEAWPLVRDADELHDALLVMGFLTEEEGVSGRPAAGDRIAAADEAGAAGDGPEPGVAPGDGTPGFSPFMRELLVSRRAAVLVDRRSGQRVWVAAERMGEFLAAFSGSAAGSVGEGAWQPLLDDAAVRAPTLHHGQEVIEGESARMRSRREPAIPEPASRPGQGAREVESLRAGEDPLVELLRSRLEGLGPVTASELAAGGGLPLAAVEAALATLESEGSVLRGSFRPGSLGTEWCSRRLLARIHRYTLEALRREIQPVSAADFIRFLAEWQGVTQEQRRRGEAGLSKVLSQLEGFTAAAASWEDSILPARIADYDGAWLDALCTSGRIVWARLSPAAAGRPARVEAEAASGAGEIPGASNALPPARGPRAGPGQGLVRSTPIGLFSRRNFSVWRTIARPASAAMTAGDEGGPARGLRHGAAAVLGLIDARGASFFDDILEGTGLLRPQLEEALGELVSLGLVTSDSFRGLRALLVPAKRAHRPRRKAGIGGIETAGRWTRLGKAGHDEAARPPRGGQAEEGREVIARSLLARYGVIVRRLLDREPLAPPWRDLVRIYRRLEARGEIRGGRFVEGFSGEQFALPEAVASLRAVRRRQGSGEWFVASAADPLNVVGVLAPGARVPSTAASRIAFLDGVPVALLEGREIRFLADLAPDEQRSARDALLRRQSITAFRRELA